LLMEKAEPPPLSPKQLKDLPSRHAEVFEKTRVATPWGDLPRSAARVLREELELRSGERSLKAVLSRRKSIGDSWLAVNRTPSTQSRSSSLRGSTSGPAEKPRRPQGRTSRPSEVSGDWTSGDESGGESVQSRRQQSTISVESASLIWGGLAISTTSSLAPPGDEREAPKKPAMRASFAGFSDVSGDSGDQGSGAAALLAAAAAAAPKRGSTKPKRGLLAVSSSSDEDHHHAASQLSQPQASREAQELERRQRIKQLKSNVRNKLSEVVATEDAVARLSPSSPTPVAAAAAAVAPPPEGFSERGSSNASVAQGHVQFNTTTKVVDSRAIEKRASQVAVRRPAARQSTAARKTLTALVRKQTSTGLPRETLPNDVGSDGGSSQSSKNGKGGSERRREPRGRRERADAEAPETSPHHERCLAPVAMPYKVVDWSSQRDDDRHAAANLANGPHGSMWESHGPPEQWLVFDFGIKVAVSSMQLRCTGLQMDPKDILLFRCGAEGSGAGANMLAKKDSSGDPVVVPDGPWIIARRCLVGAGPSSRSEKSAHNVPVGGGQRSRFWRLEVKEAWGGNRRVRILAPLVFHCLPLEQRSEDNVLAGVELQFQRQPSLTTMFSEVVNLSREDRDMRMIARKHGIPIDIAEKVLEDFKRFDVDKTGSLDFRDFVGLLRVLVARRKASLSSKSAEEKMPESRVRGLWQTVDVDGSGRIEMEEFLVWYHFAFHVNVQEPEWSRHSDRVADSVAEQFYAALGSQRLRTMVNVNVQHSEPLQAV